MIQRTPEAQAKIDAFEREWIARQPHDIEAALDWYDEALAMAKELGEWPPRDFLHDLETDIRVARIVTDPRVGRAMR